MSVSFLGHGLACLFGVSRPLPSLPQSLDSGKQAPRQAVAHWPAAAQVGFSLSTQEEKPVPGNSTFVNWMMLFIINSETSVSNIKYKV